MTGNLYTLDKETNRVSRTALVASLRLWHERLGHADPAGMKAMAKTGTVHGISLKTSANDTLDCNGCILGKGHRAPIPKKSESRSVNILNLVHSDVNGPLKIQSVGGSRYFIIFIDDFYKWTVAYTMHRKSDSL